MNEKILISVIVPSYNVEKYISRCLDSLLSQIINDKNCGAGYTENIGIKKSQGKYVMVVDSDDWISDMALNDLYKVLLKILTLQKRYTSIHICLDSSVKPAKM